MKSVIIGSGVAGIAIALRLKAKGFEVTVLEQNRSAGGKLQTLNQNGYRFDLGPSLFTMPELVDDLFLLHGKNPRTYYEYLKKDTICNYFWADGTQFVAKGDLNEFAADAAAIFNEPMQHITTYFEKNKKKYDSTAKLFLHQSLHKLKTYLSWDTLKSLTQTSKLDLNTSLHKLNKRQFNSDKLTQLFDRYATYNGSSPYKTPGIMSMIPHLEMSLGTYFPEGGMYQITKSLYQLAQEVGIVFKFEEPAKQILTRQNKAIGVKSAKSTYLSDLVISNSDIYNTYNTLLKGHKQPKKILEQERSSSAIIFYWGIAKAFSNLDLHNILFSDNYPAEFEAIFTQKLLYDDPTVYINITSKHHAADAPDGHENWFVMINAPSNHGQDWAALKTQARKNIIDKINRVLNIDLEALITTEYVLDPVGIEQNTSSFAGSLYGTASNSKYAAFLRHPNFSRRVKNLYFCGGSVHPGGGIPLCLLSAKIVSDLIKPC